MAIPPLPDFALLLRGTEPSKMMPGEGTGPGQGPVGTEGHGGVQPRGVAGTAAEVVAAGHKVAAGRMESTMQNMADLLADKFDAPLSAWDRANAHLSTFYVTNLRRKVRGLAGERLGGDGGGRVCGGGRRHCKGFTSNPCSSNP